MKIVILHQELEYAEKQFQKHFLRKGLDVVMVDIREAEFKKIIPDENTQQMIVFNRVYASVANRDYILLTKTKALLKTLEDNGIKSINSYTATCADYSKYDAFLKMKRAGISTPKTRIYNLDSLYNDLEELGGLPVIVKRDSGGRGVNLAKCYSINEIKKAVKTIQNSDNYFGNIILQEFVEPIEPMDYRVAVLGNKILYIHGRTLISLKQDELPWMGSRSLGSQIFKLDKYPEKIEDFSIKSTLSVDGIFDVLDIFKTKNGYCVIEHNLTPNYTKNHEEILGFSLTEAIVENIVSRNFYLE